MIAPHTHRSLAPALAILAVGATGLRAQTTLTQLDLAEFQAAVAARSTLVEDFSSFGLGAQVSDSLVLANGLIYRGTAPLVLESLPGQPFLADAIHGARVLTGIGPDTTLLGITFPLIQGMDEYDVLVETTDGTTLFLDDLRGSQLEEDALGINVGFFGVEVAGDAFLRFSMAASSGTSGPGGGGAGTGAWYLDDVTVDVAPGVPFEPVGTSFCNGDGGDQLGCTSCPCANDAPVGTVGGCLNSASRSARLEASGDASVSLPAGSTSDLRFALSGGVPSAFCILNSGDAVAPQNPASPCFGTNAGSQAAAYDGLRCVVASTRRHGGRSSDANGDIGSTNAAWGGASGPPAGLAVAFGGFTAGQTRYWQAVQRDDPLLGCQRGLNTSQAVRVTFRP